MAIDPPTLLREAVRAVPAVKYALGIAGLLAVVAIAKSFDLDPAFAIGGTIVTLVLMVALLVFAKLSATAPSNFVAPALVLTWGSLVLVLSAATLLFTSAFFRVPIDLRPGASEAPKPPTVEPVPPGAEVSELSGAIVALLDSREYALAWKMLGEKPDAQGAPALQVRIAEAWLRDMKTPVGTLTEVVDPLLPALYREAERTDAKPRERADAWAHIAFARSLKAREGAPRGDVEPTYRKALALDPDNTYAHALLGHWLLMGGKPVSDAQPHFAAALASGRERSFVRRYQIAGLESNRDPQNTLTLIRVCDEMRRSGETLDIGTRSNVASRVYDRDALRGSLDGVVPPGDHLATFQWLLDGLDPARSPYLQFHLARLSERAHGCATALPLYQQLSRTTVFDDEIEAALTRCGGPSSTGR